MADTSEELEWVIDAELFEKFCSDEGPKISTSDLLTDLDVAARNELECLIKFLDGFISPSYKNVACHNDKIHKLYCNLILKLPKELLEKLAAIMACETSFRKVDEDFPYKDKKPFIKTEIENKVPYIAVAHFLSHRIIVSTCKDVEKYLKHLDKLGLLRINCENVCEACKEIK